MRVPCIGGCGREVLFKLGSECRKCRRQRILAGKRRLITRAKNRKESPSPSIRQKYLKSFGSRPWA